METSCRAAHVNSTPTRGPAFRQDIPCPSHPTSTPIHHRLFAPTSFFCSAQSKIINRQSLHLPALRQTPNGLTIVDRRLLIFDLKNAPPRGWDLKSQSVAGTSCPRSLIQRTAHTKPIRSWSVPLQAVTAASCRCLPLLPLAPISSHPQPLPSALCPLPSALCPLPSHPPPHISQPTTPANSTSQGS